MIALSAGAGSSPLQTYVDHARVLVVSAPASTDAGLRRQGAQFGAHSAALRERDVVVVRAIGSGADAEAVRRAVRLAGGRFGVALVGKDGGVKLRSEHVIAAQRLIRTIDAMPMRQAEMRRSGG